MTSVQRMRFMTRGDFVTQDGPRSALRLQLQDFPYQHETEEGRSNNGSMLKPESTAYLKIIIIIQQHHTNEPDKLRNLNIVFL